MKAARCLLVLVACLGALSCCCAASDDTPHMSQFASDVNQLHGSRPLYGASYQYLGVQWLRQTHRPDGSTVSIKVKSLYNDQQPTPHIAWLLNGQPVEESDPQFQQEVTDQNGLVASIFISDDTSVSSLQVQLTLDTIETLTDVQLQPDLREGRTIVEHGTDVALALSSQEDVTFSPHTDLLFLARFFAEDLTDGSYDGLHVRFLRQHEPGAELVEDMDAFTPESHPEMLSQWNPNSLEVPAALRDNFNRPLRNHTMLRIAGQNDDMRGIVLFTAQYDNNSPCRLFGGQRITRRVFLRPAGSQ